MRRCVSRHFSVEFALSWNAGGFGLLQVAVHLWILVGCSSRLMVRVAVEMSTIASVLCCGLIQMYPSSKKAHSLAPSSRLLQVSVRKARDMGFIAAAKPHSESGIFGRFHCWFGCVRRNRRSACGAWWSPCSIERRPWLIRGRVVPD